MSFIDAISTIDIPEGGDLPLGTFTWMHGNKAGKTPGAFFGKATEFTGAPDAPSLRSAAAIVPPGVQVEVHRGGQPLYPYLFGVE